MTWIYMYASVLFFFFFSLGGGGVCVVCMHAAYKSTGVFSARVNDIVPVIACVAPTFSSLIPRARANA